MGLRLATDAWSLILGAIYGLVSLIPYPWITGTFIALGLIWRAFRVERHGVDFAPRAVALAILGSTLTLGFGFSGTIFPAEEYYPVLWEPAIRDPWTSSPALVCLAVMVGIWLLAMGYRRWKRKGLEPLDWLESTRGTITWMLLPAFMLAMMSAVGYGRIPVWAVPLVVLIWLAVSFRMGVNLGQRVVAAGVGAGLVALAFTRGLPEIVHLEPYEYVNVLAVLGLAFAFGVGFLMSHVRKRRALRGTP